MPVKVIVLLLIKGINAMFKTLSPNDVLTTCGTIAVLIPVLVWLTAWDVVVVISPKLTVQPPWWPRLIFPVVVVSTGVPCQKSCHSFHTVSISTLSKSGLPNPLTIVSKAPSWLINKSGTLFVSFHSSPGGSSVTEPAQVNTLNGFTLTYLLA